MKKQKIVLIGIMIFIFCFLFILVFNYCYKVKEVYFITDIIYPFEEIAIDKVEKRKIPAWLYHETMINEKHQLHKQFARSNTTLYPNMIIDVVMLMNDQERASFSKYCLDENEVVFSLNSDRLKNLQGLLMLDQHVDLYVSLPMRNQAPIVDWLMKNVKIIGLRNKSGEDITGNDSESVYLINLAVDKKYLTYLIKADKLGEIQLFVANDPLNETLFNQESQLIDLLS